MIINTLAEANAVFNGDISWYFLVIKYQLSESFISEFAINLDFFWVSRSQILSESFIEEFSHVLYWKNISECQNLSKCFLIKHIDKISIKHLKNNMYITNEIKEEIMILKKLTQ